jgi:hypothetical protein
MGKKVEVLKKGVSKKMVAAASCCKTGVSIQVLK